VLRVPVVDTWGSTAEDRRGSYPCDQLIEDPDLALFRAVDIAASTDVVFAWLCQLRVAPYSYDWIDNFRRRSPRTLDPALQDLSLGQRFMSIFELLAYEQGSSITLDSSTLIGSVACTYQITPRAASESHLVVKIVASTPGFLRVPLRVLLPIGDLVMMRRQLLRSLFCTFWASVRFLLPSAITSSQPTTVRAATAPFSDWHCSGSSPRERRY